MTDLDEKNPVAENFELLTPLHVAALGHNRSMLRPIGITKVENNLHLYQNSQNLFVCVSNFVIQFQI